MGSGAFFSGSVALKSKRTNDYCRDAETSVKCTSNSFGNDEKYTFTRVNNGYITIKSNDSSKYCEISYDPKLKCNKSSINDDWGKFKLVKNSDGTYSF